MSKWKGMIIWRLLNTKTLRYGELKKSIDQYSKITNKMLIESLKGLEADGLVIRKEYRVLPPKVEYSLTKQGHKLKKIWEELYSFGESYKIKIDTK